MIRKKTPVQIVFDDVIKRAVTLVLKPKGFRKSGSNYHRRKGSVVQVVNFQSSHGSSSTKKIFYVNVGLAFDSLCELTKIEVLEKPKEYECHSRGIRYRLEKIFDGVPPSWELTTEGDIETVLRDLKNIMELLSNELDKIDSIKSYRQHSWFHRYRPRRVNAQVFYVEGDLDAAWKEVQELCLKFSGRKKIDKPQYWIEELGLVKLESKNASD